MLGSAALAALLALGLADGRPPAALSGLDPVELCQGREKPGQESIDFVHGRYRYLFTTAESRATFEKDPARWRIQLGGACARMGPLSGAGGPSRFAVHDGKIYLFASDACRKAFLADPAAHLERDDARPEGDAEKGRALLARAVAAAGGEKAIDAVATYRESMRRTLASGGQDYVNVETLTIAFPGRVRTDSAWNESRYANVLSDGTGVLIGSGESHAMEESQVAALRREASRHPLAILKARSRPAFVAVAASARDGLDAVTVYFDGAATTLGLEPATGRVAKAWYRGRPGAAPPGAIVVEYSDHRDAGGGLTLPATRRVTWEGKPVDDLSGTFEIAVNPSLDPALFEVK